MGQDATLEKRVDVAGAFDVWTGLVDFDMGFSKGGKPMTSPMTSAELQTGVIDADAHVVENERYGIT